MTEHSHVSGLVIGLPLAVVAVLALGYLGLLRRRRPTLPAWPRARMVSFLLGCVLLTVAAWPAVATWAAVDFRGHMAQHLLIGMAAPLALVLGAPVTLLLGAIGPEAGRVVTQVLRTRVAYGLTRPSVALALTLVPLGALYFTPLHGWTMAHPWAHLLLHTHFLSSGYLFAWVIAGPDPAPHRPSVGRRMITLGVAVLAHATISQLMYAGVGVHVDAPVKQVRDAASLMYFGGDLIEIALALALMSRWRPRVRPGAGTGPADALMVQRVVP